MLINITTFTSVPDIVFRNNHPNTSFPRVLTDAILAPYGYAVLSPTAPPEINDHWNQRAVEGKPAKQPDGKWYQTWIVEQVTHTPDEEAQRLSDAKAAKLTEIKSAFAAAEAHGFVDSKLGFRIDATRRSIDDIEGLIDLVSSGAMHTPVRFRGYDNAYHDLTLEQLNTLRLEAKGRGPLLYARKWELEAAVDAAQTLEAVQAVDANAEWPGVEA